MKRYIRSSYEISSELKEFDRQMRSDFRIDIKVTEPADGIFGRGGYIYIFKEHGGTNVYRVFADDKNMQLIFQQIAVAFDVDGKEHYDEAIDYEFTDDLPIHQWFDAVLQWTDECETENPNFTKYED